jgi:negative regulator of flagellin synthesis FlgM
MVRDLNGVGGSQPGNAQNTKNQKAGAAGKAADVQRAQTAAPAQESVKARDSVQISAQAQSLAALEGKLKDIPDVNQKRVNELREAINSKRYTVDAERVADKILKADDDLL